MSLKLRDGVYHWRKMIEGHKFSRSTKTADKKMAEQMAALWEADCLKEIVVRGTRPVNLHQVIEAFLAAREGQGGHANARVHLKHFLALPNCRMSDVTLAQVQGVINKRRAAGTAHNTLAVTVSYYNAMVNFAEEQKWTTAVKLTPIKPIPTRLRALTIDEFNALLAAIDPNAKYIGKSPRSDKARRDNQDLLIGLVYLGCRYHELGRMQWSQIDLERGTVLVIRGKGGIDNTLMMPNRLREMLERRKATATNEWVFPTKRVHNNNYAWLDRAVEAAGIDESTGKITLHTLRHTFATWLIRAGMPLIEVQQMLGHRHYSSTLIYAKVDKGSVPSVAAAHLNAL